MAEGDYYSLVHAAPVDGSEPDSLNGPCETMFFDDEGTLHWTLWWPYMKQPFSVSQMRTADSIISC